jgi:hypothetical protein
MMGTNVAPLSIVVLGAGSLRRRRFRTTEQQQE